MKRRVNEDDEEQEATMTSEHESQVDQEEDEAVDSNAGSDGERLDFSDDDDEEEEEEEEEERPKKRKRKAKRNQFVDIEAGEADEDDEEDEDEDGYGDYAVDDGSELSDLPRPEDYIRRHQPLTRRPVQEAEEEEIDAEAEEERLRRLYGRRMDAGEGEVGGEGIPRSAMMMPKATDPKLWLVKCRPGKERDSVASIVKGLLDLDKRGQEVPPIFSAVSRDTLKGYIYLEAFKAGDIMAAVRRLHLNHVVFASQYTKPSLVPMGEMADVLAPGRLSSGKSREEVSSSGINPGDWARIKRGKYAGDLAQILEVPQDQQSVLDSSMLVRVRLLPRLSYRSTTSSAGRNKNSSATDRPPARPFDPHEAAQYGSVTKTRGLWVYAQEFYSKEGFLIKEVKVGSLALGVTPRPDELERFGSTTSSSGGDANEMPTPIKKKATNPGQYGRGDRVVIIDDGAGLRGTKGQIESVQLQQNKPAWLNVLLEGHKDIKGAMTFSVDQVLPFFDVGDQVRLISTGQSGMVVDTSPDFKSLTILSLASQQQLTIPVSEVQSADASTGSAVGKPPTIGTTSVELNDLVQSSDGVDPVFGIVTRILPEEGLITIIDQAGTSRNLTLSQVKKLDTKVIQADSSTGDAFKAGDRVQIDSVQGQATRPATILQVYRTVAFLKTLDTQEILARRFHAIHKLGPAPGSHQADQQRQRSHYTGGSGRHLLGKSVTIAGGVYKGYAGIVKEVTDNLARVELHTNSKIVNVNRDSIVSVGGAAGQSGQSFDDKSAMADERFGRGGKTPAWSSAKTPGWGTSKTPAWNAASGKTPAWNAGSGKTPAWNAGSGKTPAWNAGSGKTPAWNAGSGKTPTWNAGGKTPTWNAGGKTPTWNAAPTPAWNSSTAASSSASVAAPTASDIPVWAQQGIHVRPRGSTEAQPILSLGPGKITLQSGQSYRPSDLEPALPGKKDRVRVLAGEPGSASSTGVVIGLDGPDAVVRMDDTSSFRIVPLSNLGRL